LVCKNEKKKVKPQTGTMTMQLPCSQYSQARDLATSLQAAWVFGVAYLKAYSITVNPIAWPAFYFFFCKQQKCRNV
jgi:hypothetical protein